MSDKRPTDILKEEHQAVLKKLDSLEGIINRLERKQEISAGLKELAAFFKSDFWVHFTKEEEALFPEMEKFIPREGGPIGTMLIEHEDLRNTNDRFQQAVSRYLGDAGSPPVVEDIRRYGSHFVDVLRQHIHKEDNILFMMADMHLDLAQMEKIIGLFHKIDKG